ncbi:DUF445 family protein [Clostridium ganghwense]|uniref:DUF445 family protein n=1 Tax=Clostridium ganghwense TaxID=312089 RepID=A0ABT4CM48_9CLOT|nr:DUF445 family protein [Clostridium ganghwense]MCY6370116.1 DUF445 family protein [Clostridium ganghwense]
MISKLLFAAAIGAVIGYITNWLAIKMLFRPHTEKRILGMKIPFTPGLIPKEKDRIAKSVGEAIGTHLLTSETMVKALKTNGIDEKFKKWVERKIIEIEKSRVSIGEQIKNIVGDKYKSFIAFIKRKVTEIVLFSIRKEEFKKEAENVILDSMKKEFLKNPSSILESELYRKIREDLINKAKTYKESTEFNTKMQKIIEGKLKELENLDKTLEEVLPASFVSTIKVYVYSKNYDISMSIKDMLKEDHIKQKIKDAITGMVSSNLNPMVAMFLNPDMIYDKLSSIVEENLDKEDIQKEVALFINELIDKILKNKVSDILSNVSEEGKDRNVRLLSDIVINKVIENNFIDEIIDSLENKIRNRESIQDVLLEVNINSEKLIRNFVRDKLDYLVENKEVEEKISLYVNSSIDKVLGITLEEISKGNEKKVSKVASNIAGIIFERFITKKAGDLIEAFDIKKIVEDRINSFDVAFAEEIILEIASKELSAITWLGALLGCIMGFVSTLIAAV